MSVIWLHEQSNKQRGDLNFGLQESKITFLSHLHILGPL